MRFASAALFAAVLVFLSCSQPATDQDGVDPRSDPSGVDKNSSDLAGEWRTLLGEGALAGIAPEELSVVLITIDTLRADRLGCYGSTTVQTPHIDRLAEEGALFTNAATTVPFTLPAHSSLMTGTYPPYHGVRENVGYQLGDTLPTMAELLSDAGMEAGGFVSAFVLDRRWGIARGFDHYFDDFEMKDMKASLGAVQRDGEETIEAANEWLQKQGDNQVFLWLHLYDAHDPYEPKEPFRSQYPNAPYDAEVAYSDALIGRFRESLEATGLLERSLLILTSDHGEGLNDHGEGFHGYYIYDTTAKVPLIIRAPGGALAGREIGAAVSHVDLMPTALEAIGQPIPDVVQGRSVMPLLLGRTEPQERMVYTESLYPLLHYGWAPLRSVRTTEHKFIATPDAELFNLQEDPMESQNVLREERGLAADLRDQLLAMREAIEAPEELSNTADVDEESLAQLQALGYIAGTGEVDLAAENDFSRADPKEKIGLHKRIMAAQSAMGQQDLVNALRLLDQVLERDETMIDPHQMRGQVLMQKQKFDEAIEAFRRALELSPDHTSSLFGLAHAYRETDRPDEALVGFKRLLQLNPSDSKAALSAAKIYVEKEELATARGILEKAAETANIPPILWNQLGEIQVLEGDTTSGEASFRRAMEEGDDFAQPYFNLAVIYEEKGLLNEAISAYEDAIERAPRHYQAQFNLGRLVGHKGDLKRQEELFEAAIASNPDFVRGYYYLAKLLMDQGELDAAEKRTREGLERDPEDRVGALGHFLLADVLNRKGRLAEANAAVERGRKIQARDP